MDESRDGGSRKKKEEGPDRGSNPEPLAPKARIIPLDHQAMLSLRSCLKSAMVFIHRMIRTNTPVYFVVEFTTNVASRDTTKTSHTKKISPTNICQVWCGRHDCFSLMLSRGTLQMLAVSPFRSPSNQPEMEKHVVEMISSSSARKVSPFACGGKRNQCR